MGEGSTPTGEIKGRTPVVVSCPLRLGGLSAWILQHPAFKNGTLNVSELARVCDLSRTTVYKYLSLLEG